jgi:probable F420-dependent oxidoreductase
MAAMEFWQTVAFTEPDQLAEIALVAEEVGFTGLTIDDHIVTPSVVRSVYPYPQTMERLMAELPDAGESLWDPGLPHLDPWVVSTALAMVTSTLRFMTYIYILPLRDPFTVAKAVSSAAVLSGNRMDLGVGVGWMAEEFALTGQDFASRGERTDEMIEVFRHLLQGGMVEHHGRFYDFAPVQMSPVPTRPVPVLVGGHSGAAIRRAARNDGWLGINYDVDQVGPLLERLSAARTVEGRHGGQFRTVVAFNAPPSLDDLRRLGDAGLTSVVNPPWLFHGTPTSSIEHKRRTLEEYAERYIGPLR